jgi:hypothetical protein
MVRTGARPIWSRTGFIREAIIVLEGLEGELSGQAVSQAADQVMARCQTESKGRASREGRGIGETTV